MFFKHFTKFTGKYLCQVSFLVKLQKKDTLAQVFSFEFYEIFKNTYFYRTPLVAASGNLVPVRPWANFQLTMIFSIQISRVTMSEVSTFNGLFYPNICRLVMISHFYTERIWAARRTLVFNLIYIDTVKSRK